MDEVIDSASIENVDEPSYQFNPDNCDHEYSVDDYVEDWIRCGLCGIYNFNLARFALQKDFSRLKVQIPFTERVAGGPLVESALDCLDAWEPLIDALVSFEMLSCDDSALVCEHRVRSGLRAYICLVLAHVMYSKNERDVRVDGRHVDQILGKLHDNVLSIGGFSVIDYLGWPASTGFTAHIIEDEAADTLVALVSWLLSSQENFHLPAKQLLRETLSDLTNTACAIDGLGYSGERVEFLDKIFAEVDIAKNEMPISKGQESLLTASEVVDKLKRLIQEKVAERIWPIAYFSAYTALHRSRCESQISTDFADEIIIRQELLVPSLKNGKLNPDSFGIFEDNLNRFLGTFAKWDGDESKELDEEVWRSVHQATHEFPLQITRLVVSDEELKLDFLWEWMRLVAEYQLINGYQSETEWIVQWELAKSQEPQIMSKSYLELLQDGQEILANKSVIVEKDTLDDFDLEHFLRVKGVSKYLQSQIIDFVAFADSIDKNAGLTNHLIFQGNPGTGKTTVAEIMGEVLRGKGLLSRGHVVTVTRAELVSPYIGQTAVQTSDIIKTALGGVLFIDEAYTLSPGELSGSSQDFGKEAIETLLRDMEIHRDDLVVVAAGYTNLMQRFLRSNPGLASRFPNVWNFPDLSVPELQSVVVRRVGELSYSLQSDCLETVAREALRYIGKEGFGNARWARNLAEAGARVAAAREKKEGKNDKVVLPADLIHRPPSRSGRLTLDEAKRALNDLVGLEQVKQQVDDMIAIQELNIRRMSAGLPEVKPAMHLVFVGPPGTGKTAVAKILGEIYSSLGALTSGHTIYADRSRLVGGFTGQTALKTSEVIEKALGGVLFIDEAYTLIPNRSYGDFGLEAVETLMQYMEEYREDLLVIVAGYQKEMNRFLDSNSGLRSRFSKTLEFEAFSPKEFADVCLSSLEKGGLALDEPARIQLSDCATELSAREEFASGRTARLLVERIMISQARRVRQDKELPIGAITDSDIVEGMTGLSDLSQ